jgi:anthrone oxygenase-like protein
MLLVNGSILGAMVDLIHAIGEFVSLFFAGVLAGEELVIYYGVRTVVAVLDQQPQIQLRHALIRKLRALVPGIFILTALSGAAAMSLDGTRAGFSLRCLAALGLLIWVVTTLLGTAPINKDTLTWRPDAPPDNWRVLVGRWERFDMARCWAAVISFAFVVAAAGMI